MKSMTRVFSSRLNSDQLVPKRLIEVMSSSTRLSTYMPKEYQHFDCCTCNSLEYTILMIASVGTVSYQKSAENIFLLRVRFQFTFIVAAILAMFSYHPLVIHTIFESSLKYDAFGADYKFESLCPLSVH